MRPERGIQLRALGLLRRVSEGQMPEPTRCQLNMQGDWLVRCLQSGKQEGPGKGAEPGRAEDVRVFLLWS